MESGKGAEEAIGFVGTGDGEHFFDVVGAGASRAGAGEFPVSDSLEGGFRWEVGGVVVVGRGVGRSGSVVGGAEESIVG